MIDPTHQYQQHVSAVSSSGEAGDWYRLGCLLHDQKRWGAAAGCFARVVAIEPENFRALANLGWNLHLSGRSEEGRGALFNAIQKAPFEGTAHALQSQVLATLGRDELALDHARLAVKHEPLPAINHVALSFALMRLGHWAEGWKEYEHRFAYKIPEFMSRPYRLWRGERVEHLYLESEQGIGDTIMALRWLREAAGRADRVTLYVHGPLYSLLSAMEVPANVRALPLPQPLPQADAWCPLLSLPAALGEEEPYWPSLYVERAEVITRSFSHSKVAICWAGSPEHEMAHHRDCPLAYWMRLTENPNIKLHAVQLGPAQQQIGDMAAYGLIINRSPEITNLLDTAKVLDEMDLVITVDTAVAHLAGAMGVPCWMLVNQRGSDFRWGRGEVTPWYPSMRLWWRSLDEGWDAVLKRVDEELRGVPMVAISARVSSGVPNAISDQSSNRWPRG